MSILSAVFPSAGTTEDAEATNLQHHGNAKSGGGCAYVGGPIREVLHMRLPELEGRISEVERVTQVVSRQIEFVVPQEIEKQIQTWGVIILIRVEQLVSEQVATMLAVELDRRMHSLASLVESRQTSDGNTDKDPSQAQYLAFASSLADVEMRLLTRLSENSSEVRERISSEQTVRETATTQLQRALQELAQSCNAEAGRARQRCADIEKQLVRERTLRKAEIKVLRGAMNLSKQSESEMSSMSATSDALERDLQVHQLKTTIQESTKLGRDAITSFFGSNVLEDGHSHLPDVLTFDTYSAAMPTNPSAWSRRPCAVCFLDGCPSADPFPRTSSRSKSLPSSKKMAQLQLTTLPDPYSTRDEDQDSEYASTVEGSARKMPVPIMSPNFAGSMVRRGSTSRHRV